MCLMIVTSFSAIAQPRPPKQNPSEHKEQIIRSAYKNRALTTAPGNSWEAVNNTQRPAGHCTWVKRAADYPYGFTKGNAVAKDEPFIIIEVNSHLTYRYGIIFPVHFFW